MKKTTLFISLIVSILSILSCSKSSSSNNNGNSPYAGNWRGTWNQVTPSYSGTWQATIDGNGTISGIDNLGYIISGSVSNSGSWNATGGTDGGDIFTGNIVGSQVNGTWTNPSNNWRGSFTGSKQ